MALAAFCDCFIVLESDCNIDCRSDLAAFSTSAGGAPGNIVLQALIKPGGTAKLLLCETCFGAVCNLFLSSGCGVDEIFSTINSLFFHIIEEEVFFACFLLCEVKMIPIF